MIVDMEMMDTPKQNLGQQDTDMLDIPKKVVILDELDPCVTESKPKQSSGRVGKFLVRSIR